MQNWLNHNETAWKFLYPNNRALRQFSDYLNFVKMHIYSKWEESMMVHMVMCVKLGKQAAGLKFPP